MPIRFEQSAHQTSPDQQPDGIRLSPGQTIFDAADEFAIKVPTSCGRAGTCHECIVEIRRGVAALSERSDAEQFLQENLRLACQAQVVDPDADVVFSLMKRKRQIISEGARRSVKLDPLTYRVGDDVYFDGAKVDTYRGAIYGLAVDVGTTTVVMNLLDLETGDCLFTSSIENPQRFGGSDVMHRISYDGGPFHGELHLAIVNAVNTEIREMCRALRFSRRLIYEIVVVGNTTMRDIFFDLDVQSIGEKPYKSLTEHAFRDGERESTSIYTKPFPLGIHINRAATIYGGPLIGSHVGADVAADLIATGMDELDDGVVMLVDIGTNTEVVVGNARRMVAASCPAGPAFEGGHVSYGMPGYEGAIESVRIEDGRIIYDVIGGAAPEGIAGSGLIDLLAELVRAKRMSPLGVFSDGGKTVAVVPERGITFSRSDASQLAQAKAANYCGQYIVMRASGVPPEQIQRLYLAGGFANYVDVENAVRIGFVASLPTERIVKVGNAALEGASMILLSRQKREMVEKLVRRVEHIELETTPDFFDLFVEGCMFKPMDLSALSAGTAARPG